MDHETHAKFKDIFYNGVEKLSKEDFDESVRGFEEDDISILLDFDKFMDRIHAESTMHLAFSTDVGLKRIEIYQTQISLIEKAILRLESVARKYFRSHIIRKDRNVPVIFSC